MCGITAILTRNKRYRTKNVIYPFLLLMHEEKMGKDGIGYAYYSNVKKTSIPIICKSTEIQAFLDTIKRSKQIIEPDSVFIMHIRLGTTGGVKYTNCHPFSVCDKFLFCGNGMVRYAGTQSLVEKNKNTKNHVVFGETDTEALGHWIEQNIPEIENLQGDQATCIKITEKLFKLNEEIEFDHNLLILNKYNILIVVKFVAYSLYEITKNDLTIITKISPRTLEKKGLKFDKSRELNENGVYIYTPHRLLHEDVRKPSYKITYPYSIYNTRKTTYYSDYYSAYSLNSYKKDKKIEEITLEAEETSVDQDFYKNDKEIDEEIEKILSKDDELLEIMLKTDELADQYLLTKSFKYFDVMTLLEDLYTKIYKLKKEILKEKKRAEVK